MNELTFHLVTDTNAHLHVIVIQTFKSFNAKELSSVQTNDLHFYHRKSVCNIVFLLFLTIILLDKLEWDDCYTVPSPKVSVFVLFEGFLFLLFFFSSHKILPLITMVNFLCSIVGTFAIDM